MDREEEDRFDLDELERLPLDERDLEEFDLEDDFEGDGFLLLSLDLLLLLSSLSRVLLCLLRLLLSLLNKIKKYELTRKKEIIKNESSLVYDFLLRLSDSLREEGVLLREHSFFMCPGLPHR